MTAGRERTGLHLDGLEGLDLVVAPGELVALIGPSGSGKTTLLRSVAGLDPMPQGEVRLDGRPLTGVPVERRPVTMMFETAMLFGQLTVAQNVGFAADRSRGATAVADEVDAALTSLDLALLASRHPHELSAGERQRVALARALVRRPEVMLFDEPLAHVDPAARVGLRREILRTHRRMGAATVYVTHDWHDALAIADRIAVMREGRLVQIATPRELFLRPASTWIATRIGVPNLLAAEVEAVGAAAREEPGGGADPRPPQSHRVTVEVLGQEQSVPASTELQRPGESCVVLCHPQALVLHPVAESASSAVHGVDRRHGRILGTTFGGGHVDYDVETDSGTLVARRILRPWEEPWPAGTAVRVELDPEQAWAVHG